MIKTFTLVANADAKTMEVTIHYEADAIEGLECEISDVVIFTYVAANNADGYAYVEESVAYVVNDNGTITVTLTAEQYDLYINSSIANALGAGCDFGIDVYYDAYANGVDLSNLNSVYYTFPAAE